MGFLDRLEKLQSTQIVKKKRSEEEAEKRRQGISRFSTAVNTETSHKGFFISSPYERVFLFFGEGFF